ncbi:hypothetical protein ANSO36C_66180 (plasmid) [Nostoc cf. commune SO-36]|uniref:Uncharacterized protein n=1 Tax=Nostoc cf. commune SO-36 TaxID=449208 RepID=A0ABM7ZBZ4_NOSCO|nr:hypothetical protein ANSO36C_66180 [Nostoc cf. commune SO-36]
MTFICFNFRYQVRIIFNKKITCLLINSKTLLNLSLAAVDEIEIRIKYLGKIAVHHNYKNNFIKFLK